MTTILSFEIFLRTRGKIKEKYKTNGAQSAGPIIVKRDKNNACSVLPEISIRKLKRIHRIELKIKKRKTKLTSALGSLRITKRLKKHKNKIIDKGKNNKIISIVTYK